MASKEPKAVAPEVARLGLLDDVDEELTVPAAIAAWVGVGREQADLIASAAADPPLAALSVFWLRVYASLDDVKRWASRRKAELDANEELRPDSRMPGAIEAVLASVARLHGLLTVDELLYLDFVRQAHAHPSLTGFTYAPQQDGQRVWTYTSRLTGAQATREDVRHAVERVLATHGGEAGAARLLAARTCSALRDVEASLWAFADSHMPR